jgi:hypothetical protein
LGGFRRGQFVNDENGPSVNSADASTSALVHDLDGDQHVDLLVSNARANGKSSRMYLYLGDGGGGFTKVAEGAHALTIDAAGTQHAIAADFNQDTNVDLYLPSPGRTSMYFLGDGAGGFTRATTGPATLNSQRQQVTKMAVAEDFSGDQIVDLYLVNVDTDTDSSCANSASGACGNQLLINDGNGVFTEILAGVVLYAGRATNAVAADVTGDNILDLLLSTNSPDWNQVYVGDHDASHGYFTQYAACMPASCTDALTDNPWLTPRKGAVWTAAADVNGDSHVDLYTVHHQATNDLLLGDGTGAFTAVTTGDAVTSTPARHQHVVFADVDADGHLDIYASVYDPYAQSNGFNKLLMGDGAGGFTKDMTSNIVMNYQAGTRSAVFADMNR